MKITDLNLICLEECFEYLELRELSSVADANKRLRRAAEYIFFRKYRKQTITLDVAYPFPHGVHETWISLRGDLKTSFQILRCFGHMIEYVRLYLKGSFQGDHCRIEQRLLDQLNECCADSVVNFTVIVFSYYETVQDKWKIFTKPFTRAEYVTMCGNGLIEKEEKLNRLLPKLKELEYFADGFSWNELRNLIEPMQNLEELTLSGHIVSSSDFTGNKIKSKSIKKFKYSHYEKGYSFLFDQLEDFESSHLTDTSHSYDFIEQHPSIRKLTISTYNKSNINFSRISKALPSLKELHFEKVNDYYAKQFSVNDLLRLVFIFESVEKICFTPHLYQPHIFYDELRVGIAKSPLVDQLRLSVEKKTSYLMTFILERLDHN